MTETARSYNEWRANVMERFASLKPVTDSLESHVSPSGEFVLEVCEHSAGEATWSYTRGLVRRLGSSSLVAEVVRNYGIFWFSWARLAGEEFLLCGGDYQGYNVINLSTGKNQLTFPFEAFDGGGYCWAAAYPSPDGEVIAVEGCYWACPYSLTLYDFREPMRSPLPQLARFEDLDEVKGWMSPTEFAFSVGEGEERRAVRWQPNEA